VISGKLLTPKYYKASSTYICWEKLKMRFLRIIRTSWVFFHLLLTTYHLPLIMTLKDAQEQVDHWIKTIGVRYFSELTNTAVLMEEVGELARIMARRYGEQSFKEGDKDNLEDEMADVLWVLICLANQTGVDLEKAFVENMEKKSTRDKKRHKENLKL